MRVVLLFLLSLCMTGCFGFSNVKESTKLEAKQLRIEAEHINKLGKYIENDVVKKHFERYTSKHLELAKEHEESFQE